MPNSFGVTPLRIFAAALLLCTFTGCGNGLSGLKGKVLVDGNPAPAGVSLQFSPVAGGSPSYAETDADGRYEAAFTFREKGIEVGEHLVSLVPGGGSGSGSMPVIGEDGNPVAGSGSGGGNASPSFPQKYYSEITKITVKPGSNEIDIELESSKK